MTSVLTVSGGRPLRGEVRVPGDKSISHRALILAGLAHGRSMLSGLSDGDDVARTADAMSALGAQVGPDWVEGFDRPGTPAGTLDVGNSGTTMRLLAGLVAPFDIEVQLAGDASLSRRPMDRVAIPLRSMGARVDGMGERCHPPIVVHGGDIHGIDYTPPMASAQVKSCVLLAGLGAEGQTVVREPVPTRRHTEELLGRCGADMEIRDEQGTHVVAVRRSRLQAFELEVPADPSQAAFWVVAATVVPGSDIIVKGVYAGPQRRGFLDVLARMGAQVEEEPAGDPAFVDHVVDLRVRSAELHATSVPAAEITGLDEVPALAVAAALAEGTTVFRSVGELRVKESDRLAGILSLLAAFGATATAEGDDLAVHGTARLHHGHLDAAGDHRMAMAAAVAALAAGDGESTLSGWQAVDSSYRSFASDLRMLTEGNRGDM